MKKETIKKSDVIWIDIHNDDVMRENGLIRHFPQSPRDKNVWTKTPYERKILKNAKYSCRKDDMHFHVAPHKFIPVKDKLIIHLKKNKSYPKSTYSIECWQSDIPYILSKYKSKSLKSIVANYSWNGKTYSQNELPFWG